VVSGTIMNKDDVFPGLLHSLSQESRIRL
jgi:hypothetical protein